MAKTPDQVLEETTQVFRDVLDNPSVRLVRETTAADVEGWDSLSHIEIVVAIEKHFKIRFNFAELQKFQNVGDLCDNVAKLLSK